MLVRASTWLLKLSSAGAVLYRAIWNDNGLRSQFGRYQLVGQRALDLNLPPERLLQTEFVHPETASMRKRWRCAYAIDEREGTLIRTLLGSVDFQKAIDISHDAEINLLLRMLLRYSQQSALQ